MDEIEQTGTRIVAALDRLQRGIDTLSTIDAGEFENLKTELEAERLANGQLEERLNSLSAKQEASASRARAATEAAADRVARLDVELQKMHKANAMLAENNAALREANAAGIGDPSLVNAGLKAELEAMRAARAAEAAELSSIREALQDLLAQHAPEGETAHA